MTATTDLAMNTTVDAIVAGATAIAEAFGLGTGARPAAGWQTDDGDTVIGARTTGAAPGLLLLAVNDAVADRLTVDDERLRNGFQRALDAIATAAGMRGRVAIDRIERTDEVAPEAVEIVDDGETCALFWFVPGAPDNRRDAPGGATVAGGPASFEPAAFVDNGATVASPSLGPLTVLQEVEMDVTVELGRTRMPIRELLALQPGMVVEIDRLAGAPIDVLVNGRPIACGEIVVIDEEFGVRITEIVDPGARV